MTFRSVCIFIFLNVFGQAFSHNRRPTRAFTSSNFKVGNEKTKYQSINLQFSSSSKNDVSTRAIRETRGGDSTTLLNMLSFSSTTPGLVPAVLSPISSALGFMFWDKNWHGSAFSLNMVKNFVASVFFIMATFVSCQRQNIWPMLSDVTPFMIPLLVSAFLGVVIGDSTAIASLRRLGSRRYLLMDCLKPALSVIIGLVAFGEMISMKSALGIFCIVFGVYTASIQKVDQDNNSSDHQVQQNTILNESNQVAKGYLYAVGHLIFDTVGAAITKKCMEASKARDSLTLGPLLVGLLRFGSAAFMLLAISLLGKLTSSVNNSNEWWSLPKTVSENTYNDDSESGENGNMVMTKSNWEKIICGTFFVTFLGPSLFYRSLQFMSLGIGVTLSCTAPVYEPILSKILYGQDINGKSMLSCLLAVSGVALICVK